MSGRTGNAKSYWCPRPLYADAVGGGAAPSVAPQAVGQSSESPDGQPTVHECFSGQRNGPDDAVCMGTKTSAHRAALPPSMPAHETPAARRRDLARGRMQVPGSVGQVGLHSSSSVCGLPYAHRVPTALERSQCVRLPAGQHQPFSCSGVGKFRLGWRGRGAIPGGNLRRVVSCSTSVAGTTADRGEQFPAASTAAAAKGHRRSHDAQHAGR